MRTATVKLWGVVAAVALSLLAVLGLPIPAACGAVLNAGLGGLLVERNRANLPHPRSNRTDEETRDVIWVLAVSLALPSITCIVVLIVGHVLGGRVWPFRVLAGSAAAAAATLFLSSLTDWAYVWPRLRGYGRAESQLPCRPGSSINWRSLTQVWLAHRLVAYAIVRLSILTALGIVAVALPKPSTAVRSVLVGILGVLAAYYLNRLFVAAPVVTNPPVHVGDRVTLADEFGAGIDRRPTYYVVDVSMEGVSLLEVGPRDQPLTARSHPPVPPSRVRDRILPLDQITRLLRGRASFAGCFERCCLANEYCPHKYFDSMQPIAPSQLESARTK